MKDILEALQGKKTYLILGAIFVLLLVTGGDTESVDFGRVLSDPEFALQTLSLLLAGAFRSALSKIGS